ncbi:toxin regulator [Qiania dongpingensis]|uniref:Toxin regulator n=1 Tax=Qiania dongpingensis TaxID=2763669 RepID=A0A7G9G607_9FIRM|nr:toxin regulator [Qiania dongpingensis]QNM06239.1 toxin regulator [Qiania dongpingensis]
MKKKLLGVFCAASLLLTGCSSGVPQEEHESLKADYESVKTDLESAKASQESASSELENVKSQSESLSSSLEQLQNEYNTYKESMSAYEGLSAAEAEARRIEAESIAAAEAESKAQAEAEAAAAAEAAAKVGYETGITYDQLARTPDEFKSQKVKFSGKVVQVIEGTGKVQIRLAVDSDYDTILLGEYDSSIVGSRVLEDDKITIYGTSIGTISYQSTMGGTITIPGVSIEKIDQ